MFLQVSVTQPLLAERYRLVRSLGQGGMGRVWLARDEVLHRDVAIKEVIPPEGLTAEERDEMRQRTLREARAAARLNHPSVVRVYDVIRTDVHPWIVMEYVASRSLHEVIAEDGTLPPARVAQIGLQVLGALRAAHRAGVLHRDVKPSNVLLTDDGRVVLTDFGLATMPGEATVTRPGMVLGSPAYISPERAREGYAGPESDLWSLGATLYAGVEGNSPYQRSSAIATLSALVTEDPPPARHAGPLRPVLNGLLKKDPAARIDAAEAERLLRRAAGGGLASRLWLVPKPRPGAARSNPVPEKPLPQGGPGAMPGTRVAAADSGAVAADAAASPDPGAAASGDEKSNPPAAATADTTDRAGATVVVKPAAASSSR
ncbi:MAG: eukaryotic-like serine/threonine-protein kinase, partial [Micromonosporaceae bacterium]|nr:eukaryotic-like serine/threonine-protein kinase [Micromonosporaceae bacterium]